MKTNQTSRRSGSGQVFRDAATVVFLLVMALSIRIAPVDGLVEVESIGGLQAATVGSTGEVKTAEPQMTARAEDRDQDDASPCGQKAAAEARNQTPEADRALVRLAPNVPAAPSKVPCPKKLAERSS